MTVSRRSFLRYASATSAATALLGATEFRFARAQLAPRASEAAASERVMINANENPLGPCAAARAALADAIPNGGRYLFPLADKLVATFAAQNGLKHDAVRVYAGSSEPLQYAVLAFTSPTRSLVTANPTYEAAWEAADFNGARSIKIPLAADYSHDVRKMIAADPKVGLIHICNPNNPTGSVTARADIEWALTHKPKGAVVLVDEAYIQFSDERSVIDLVAAGADLVVLRTFSKLYGMAGLRCGFAVARPDLLKRIARFGDNPMPITATAAALASLEDAALIPERKRINAEIRTDTLDWMRKKGFRCTASASNCFMVDTGRDGKHVIAAMAERGVDIGRTWTIWPSQVRITVGTRAEMERFQSAFEAVMALPVAAIDHAAMRVGDRVERLT